MKHAVLLTLAFDGSPQGAASRVKPPDVRGSRFLSHDFQSQAGFFGIESSPALVREPVGNDRIERFFRSLKARLFRM